MSKSLYLPVAGLGVGGGLPAHITTLENEPRLRRDIDIPYYGSVLMAIGLKLTTIDDFPTDVFSESGTDNRNHVQKLLRDADTDLLFPLGVCVLPLDGTHPIESTFYLLRGMGIHGLNVASLSEGVCGNHSPA